MCIFVHSPKEWYFYGVPLPHGKVPSQDKHEEPVPGGKDGEEKDFIVDWFRDGEKFLDTEEEMLDMLPGDRVKAKEVMHSITQNETKSFTLATLPISVYTAGLTDENGKESENVYHRLNADIRLASKCRAQERREIRAAWGLYIRALITSLRALHPFDGYCYRGIRTTEEEIERHYYAGARIRWTSFTSASWSMNAAFQFAKFYLPCEAGQTHTMFRIKSATGRRIDHFSMLDKEDEILFEPNSWFAVANPQAKADPPCIHSPRLLSNKS